MVQVLDPSRIELLDEDMVRVLKGKSPEERIAIVLDANRTMRLMLQAHLRESHPDWTENQIAVGISRRLLGGTG